MPIQKWITKMQKKISNHSFSWEICLAILLQSSAALPWHNGVLTQKRWKVKIQKCIKYAIWNKYSIHSFIHSIYDSKYVIVEKVISRTRYWNITVLVDFETGKMNYGLKIIVLLLVFSNVSFAARSAKGKSQKLGLISS